MKSCRNFLPLAAAIFALSTTATMAQDQGRAHGFRTGGESPNDPTYLLASESVQKELLLTDSQKARLKKLRGEENDRHPFSGGFIGLSQAEIQKKRDQHAKENRDRTSKILTPQQSERLNEIYIQAAGVAALNFADVAEKLQLSAEQKAKLKNLADESRRKQTALNDTYNSPSTAGQKPAQGRENYKRELNQVTAERKNQALAVLTDEQRAKFEKLQGEKFDTSTIRPMSKNFSRRGRMEAPAKARPVRTSTSS